MEKNALINLNKDIILDGAMGTMLMQRSGAPIGYCLEKLNIENTEIVKSIHREYVNAGSDIISANTFGANRYKTEDYQVLIKEGIKIAKECAEGKLVALDISPTGKIIGDGGISFNEAYQSFKSIVLCGENADIIFLETFTDLVELRIAVLAATENTDKPVIAFMSFSENMRSAFGSSIESFVKTIDGLGVSGIGVNCSLGAKEMFPIAERIIKLTKLPVFIKPNAGMPKNDENGETYYEIEPAEFADYMFNIKKLGVNALGGCCGTTPEYIKELKSRVENLSFEREKCLELSIVCGSCNAVEIDGMKVIGERINPTGKKRFQQALKEQDFDYIIEQGLQQEELGVDILDVNVGINDIDETQVMLEVIKRLQIATSLPLQIDSSNVETIELALRNYTGKAIVNSVNGKEESMNAIFPLVSKYGASVVALTLDENGIPQTGAERIEIAKRIIERAESFGIKKYDIYVDTLTMAEASLKGSALATLEALSEVKKLGVKTVLGVSNISFGMPNREDINSAFLKLAKQAGLDLCIINPKLLGVVPSTQAELFLTGVISAEDYIDYATKLDNQSVGVQEKTGEIDLFKAILTGQKELAGKLTEQLLKSMQPLEIAGKYVIKALDEVGERYENGKMFLPQLISAADSAKEAFKLISYEIGKTKTEKSDKRFVIATVKGDVHDIGKNIVKAVVENYGFEVIDLGKDVDYEIVLKAVEKNYPCVLGLSALMTTTVCNMKKTIELVKEKFDIPILVGGAVLTPEYAQKIGGTYCLDANDTVKKLKEIFKEC